MRPRLTRYTPGFTVAEFLVGSTVAVILTVCALQAFLASRQTYSLGTSREGLQQAASLITRKIIEGPPEAGLTAARLSEAVFFNINSISDFQFTGLDGITRRYYLDATKTNIFYVPDINNPAVQMAIYTANPQANVTLRFWLPHTVPSPGESDAGQYVSDINIDVAISQQVFGNNVTGSVSTMVNLRNHP